MLMLAEERTMKFTRNKHGEMVRLSEDTCNFILRYCLNCLTPAEHRLALTPRIYHFLEDDCEEGKEVIKKTVVLAKGFKST